MKSLQSLYLAVLLMFAAVFLVLGCEKRWYVESGQRKRFHKIDSMKALHEEWKVLYTATPEKYDSLRPLIDKNLLNWELQILETEIRAYELMGF